MQWIVNFEFRKSSTLKTLFSRKVFFSLCIFIPTEIHDKQFLFRNHEFPNFLHLLYFNAINKVSFRWVNNNLINTTIPNKWSSKNDNEVNEFVWKKVCVYSQPILIISPPFEIFIVQWFWKQKKKNFHKTLTSQKFIYELFADYCKNITSFNRQVNTTQIFKHISSE